MGKLKRYTHLHTGSVDTKEGWILSYDSHELEDRGITAEQAFEEDEDVTLFEIEN